MSYSSLPYPPLTRTAPYTPYMVSVAAINGAGIGNFISIVAFTAEGGKISFSSQFKFQHFTQFPYLILEILVPLD